ncbi:hypothetical protein BDM02DRAFT_1790209 [Thelephora ganbajun]|uniref:Uncharacterized protein n=1 Tax=Thelephora ganbajun TaxID=370292 RepID=A0ACB6ZJC4_THEGA|nr:hypothetical protein BDM02DRAFT_1790209 [Thelephora ganbajun]
MQLQPLTPVLEVLQSSDSVASVGFDPRPDLHTALERERPRWERRGEPAPKEPLPLVTEYESEVQDEEMDNVKDERCGSEVKFAWGWPHQGLWILDCNTEHPNRCTTRESDLADSSKNAFPHTQADEEILWSRVLDSGIWSVLTQATRSWLPR